MATTTNTGTILVGVTLDGGDSLINTATGSVTGPGIAVLGLGGTTAATVDNFGIILGASQPAVELLSGGVVLNRAAATISAAGAVGVTISGGKGTVRNAGTIAGATSAVLLAAGYANRVIVDPGAAFTGTVQGGNTLFNNTLNSTLISTLELASGATTGTLTGLNSQFVNFQSVTIDAGGSWVMDATNTGTANQNVAAFGTLTNLASFNRTIVASNNGVVSNSTTGTILSVLTGGVGSTHATVVNAGLLGSTLSRGVRLGTGATLTNLSSGTIVGRVAAYSAFDDSRNAVDVGTNAVAINAGRIVGSYGTRGHGISFLGSGATVTNQSGGTITGLDAVFAYNLSGANTLINAGRINVNATSAAHGVRFMAGGTVINQAGGIILGYTAIDIRNGTAPRVVNAGSIGGVGQAIFMYGGSSVTNQAGGTITSSGQGPSGAVTDAAIAFFGNAAVTNAGSIGANSTIGTGISGSGGSVTNQSGGAITGKYAIYLSGNGTVTNAGGIGGNSATGIGVQMNQQGLVINQSTGTIRAATGVQFNIVGYNATLRNAGLIVGDTGTAVKFGSYAVDNRLILDPGAAFTGIVDGGPTLGNTDGYISTLELASGASAGTLSGFGTQFINFANITVDSNASWTLASSNMIGTGYAIVDAGSLTNAGTLATAVTLGSGALLANASTGVIDVSGTAVVASAGAVAVVNAGTIAGSSTGGVGIYLAAGGTVTNQGSGTITGVADAVLFKAGFTNRLVVAPGAVFKGTVSGGNTIGATAVSTLELASGASVGTLSGLGTQFVNFAAVTVDAGAAWVLASGNSLATSQTLLVDGTLTNQASLSQSITLGQNGLLTNSATGTLVTAVGYHGSGATHQTVVNAGRLGNTNVRGVHLDSGGTLTNLSTGTIVGRVGGVQEVRDSRYAVVMESGGVVVNAGRIIGGSRVFGVGVVLDGGGTLTNQSSGSISGQDGIMARVGAATVVNAGTLNGQQAAIDMYAGGLVTNQTGGVVLGNNSILFRTIAGTIINDGLISAPQLGVDLRAGGSITNQASGTIVSTGVGYYGSNGIAIRTRGLSTVVNRGSISASLGDGTGIDLDTGLLTNQASATVVGYIGVKLGAATLVNAGLILGDAAYGRAVSFYDTTSVTKGTVTVTNQATGTLQAATGFYVYGGNATLANAGLIVGSAGTAAHFAAGYTNRLILTKGAVFTGLVDGGNTIGATAVSTLELGSGATEGTLSSLGTQFVNFAAITVAGGGIWSIDPASPVAANQSLLVGGTLVNRDTLTHAITFSSGGVVSNAAAGTISSATISIFGATIGGDGTVLNAGLILGSAAAVGLLSGGGVSNASTGRIAGTSVGVYLTTSSTVANSGSVFNAGTIIGTTAQGIEIAAGGTVSNAGTGLISGGYRGLSIGVPNTAQSALVINRGSIVGGAGAGVSVGAGTITNVAGGTISGVTQGIDATGRLTLVDAGVIVATGSTSRAVELHAGGFVSIQSGGRVTGGAVGIDIAVAEGTVTNAGSIVGSSAGASGIRLQAGGSISNAASGDIIAAFGVYISSVAATVSNSGTIRGTANNGVAFSVGGSVTNAAIGTIVGHYSAVNFHTAAASVSNAGTLTSTDASGVNGNVGGMITNLSGGTIQGKDYGVLLSGAAGTVSNAGIVIGTNNRGVYLSAGGVVTNASAGTIFGYGGVAIDGAAGTVVNLGSIGASGANAVRLAAGFTDRLIVSPGAAFTGKVDGGNTIGATAASTLELTSGASAGTISGFGGQFVNFANTTIDAGASWTLTGTNTLALGATLTNAGTLTLLNASLTDAGALVNNGGIILDPSTLVVSGLTGNGSVTIAAGSTLEVTGTVSSGETIVFGGLGAFLKIDSPAAFAGRIVNFDAGQTIDLVGIAPATVGYTSGSGVLNFGTSGGTIALSSLAPASLNVGASSDGAGLTSTLCFRANTMLLTPSGERSVRDLRVGDAVTVCGGGTRPIVWIGVGKVLATRGRRGPATPTIVRKGALGDNVPARDLHVTKGHALYVDDVLIPVEFLVNHRSIVWDDHAQEVELYHIELDRHDVLIANGAPAESYRDDGNRWLFQNANNGWDLPALEPFAPVLTGGPIVDAVWRRMLDRAGPRDNLTLTDDPDLHLRVDGKRINPLFGDGDRFMFRLRSDADEIRLMSRSGVPSELGVARDARALGVAVRAIRLRTDTRIKTIGAADERLTDGFHAFEADNDIRWTNGDASLPIDRLGTARGTLLLEVVLGGRTRYLDTGYGSVAGSVPGRAAA